MTEERIQPKAVWWFEHAHEEYRDYRYCVPDASGYGVALRLTLIVDEKRAYMGVHIDNENGDWFGEATINNVPWDVACAMTGYVHEEVIHA